MSARSINDPLAGVRVASPCPARWEDMEGDERARFCRHCQKHVYNFTAMTTEEVVAMIQAKEGRLCGRFFQRPDGTVMAQNCPIGLAKVRQQMRRTLLGAAALVAFLFTSVVMAKEQEQEAILQKGKVSAKVDEAVEKIKVKLGFKPPPSPPILLGKICMPMPVSATNNPSGNGVQTR